MGPRGFWVVGVLLVLSAGFLGAFFLVGEDLRPDYRVASRLDRERTDLDLTPQRVAWLEDARPGGAVLAYDIAAKRRVLVEPGNASLTGGIALDGDLVAWMDHRSGSPRIRVHDLARNVSAHADAAGDSLALVPRGLEGRDLLAWGTVAGESRPGMWWLQVSITSADHAAVSTSPLPRVTTPNATVSQGRVWWSDGPELRAVALATGAPVANVTAGAAITSFAVHGDVVVWAEHHGKLRRAFWADVARGTRGELSQFPADQHSPAVHGTQVVFVQHDGLVRHVDLASGQEQVLPARTQENRRLAITEGWAAWLSGTIEGHNVFLTPVPPRR